MYSPKMSNLIRVFLLPLILFGISTAQELGLDRVGNDATLPVGLVMARPNANAQWGYICDDRWNIRAAQVVCRHLEYGDAFVEPGLVNEYRPQVTQPANIALTNVQCVGNETSLWDCMPDLQDRWNPDNCVGSGLAGVTCGNVSDPVPDRPNLTLQCTQNNMTLEYPVPWTVLPYDQNLLVQNGVNYLTTPYNSPQLQLALTDGGGYISYSRRVIMTYPAYLAGAALFQRYDVDLECRIPRQLRVSQTFQAQGTISVGGETTIGVQMILYQGRNFQTPVQDYPYQLPMGEWLNMAVVMNADDDRLRVVVTDCFAAPSPDVPIGQNYIFYDDRCLVNPAISATYPLDNDRFGFRLQSFVFDGYNQTILTCSAIICLQTDLSPQCDRSCNPGNRRQRRDTMETSDTGYTVYTIKSPLIYFGDPASTTGQTTPTSTRTSTTTTARPTPASTTSTERSVNTRVVPVLQERKVVVHQQSRRLVMTLGNVAVSPSVPLALLLIPTVVTLMLAGATDLEI